MWRALFISFLLCTSCAINYGGLKVNNLDRPLQDLQRVAQNSLPLGMRKVSTNHREFYSNYFIAVDRSFRPAEQMPQRSYAVIYVLGDMRPYTIEVVVIREKKGKGSQYVAIGKDKRIATVIRTRLQKELSKRREDRNMIDDFRAF